MVGWVSPDLTRAGGGSRPRPAANLDGMRQHGKRRHQQRNLEQIEQCLAASDPRLVSMFAMFTTVTRYEPMPVTERATPWRKRFFGRASVMLSAYWLIPPIPAP